ncbi:MAG: hypothetical protein ACFFCT_03090 [Candidatus Odinarchaeota archaeon]
MQVILQSFWDLLQVVYFMEILGLIVSIVLSLFLLLRYRISETAWKYGIASMIAFFFGGNSIYFIDGNASLYGGAFIFIIGGYLLILVALFQYVRDEDVSHIPTTSHLE